MSETTPVSNIIPRCLRSVVLLTTADTLPRVSVTEAVELPEVAVSLACTSHPVDTATTDITPLTPAPHAKPVRVTAFTPSRLSRCQFLTLHSRKQTCLLICAVN